MNCKICRVTSKLKCLELCFLVAVLNLVTLHCFFWYLFLILWFFLPVLCEKHCLHVVTFNPYVKQSYLQSGINSLIKTTVLIVPQGKSGLQGGKKKDIKTDSSITKTE